MGLVMTFDTHIICICVYMCTHTHTKKMLTMFTLSCGLKRMHPRRADQRVNASHTKLDTALYPASFCKVFVVQARGLDFGFPAPHITEDTLTCAYNSSTREAVTGRLPGAHWPVSLTKSLSSRFYAKPC